VFVGIIENYKNDESIKVNQLESYFKPARASANACLNAQNDLFLHYPEYGGAISLFFGELKHLIDNPELEGRSEYEIVMQGYARYLRDVVKKQSELPAEVQECREEVFLDLEALSIATGIFKKFSEEASKRARSLNQIDKNLRKKLKENAKGFDAKDLQELFRSFAKTDMTSRIEMEKLISKFDEKLPVIEGYSVAMGEAERKKYEVESNFFSEIRKESAEKINSRFKQGFFSWLVR